MHRSRTGVVLIDIAEDSYEASLDFWSTAAGKVAIPEPGAFYAHMGQLGEGVNFEMQRTGAGLPPRIHLDVESDNVTAEVSRLQTAGATVHEPGDGYVIMRDPAGLVFCVVGVQTDYFDASAATWS